MILATYKEQIERELLLAVERMGDRTVLRDACAYALALGGKRVRPLIVLITAEAVGKGLNAMEAALSVEYFHTASLIADDLPSMDDDDLRRNRPSLHKAFGEDVALLASYTLIAAGYGGIRQNGADMGSHPGADRAVILSLEAATRCGGLQGATQGQFYDLHPPDRTWETLKKTIYLKTVTLFEISFIFGWLFGGGSSEALPRLKDCAYHLGMAFQISDDLEDGDVENRELALALFDESIGELKGALQEMGLWTAPFQELFVGLSARSRFFSSRLLGQATP